HGAVVERRSCVGLAELVVVGREHELLVRAVERERSVVAAAGEEGLRRALGEVADVRAVLRGIARDNGVGEDLRAVLERVGEDVVALFLGARLEVAEDDGGAVLPPRPTGGCAAWATTAAVRPAGG